MAEQGSIFNIQKFSIHDGPGIRTTVFLKGCPLRCQWCHNPESNSVQPELQLYPHLCTGCGACVRVCPQGCISIDEDGHAKTDRSACSACGACAEVCLSAARQIAGKEMTAEAVIREAGKDWRFFNTSGGGITFSGGEPLMQPEFLLSMIAEAEKRELHLAIETCCYAPWENAKPILSKMDCILVDIKAMDSQRHKALTGVPNERILENITRIASELTVPFWLRIPLIAGVNDAEEEMRACADYIDTLARPPERVCLLPFHDLGISKLMSLDMPTETMAAFQPPSEEKLVALREILEAHSLTVASE